ncbi:GSC1 [Cyberlindnera jadinii]|uniref:1,3-beta-glucan synthase n=2 Tax=Saccharomycetes TaxID=4891 RepID=A0A0H5C349_CYBJN|nr:GSC1 [Cyberlindnera jadinii]
MPTVPDLHESTGVDEKIMPNDHISTEPVPDIHPRNLADGIAGIEHNDWKEDTSLPVNALHDSRDAFPSWNNDDCPITQAEIYHIFEKLRDKFGFQCSSMENMFDHLMIQLDSRASRFHPLHALTSLHASYIGGENSNYKKWFFAARLNLDEEVGFSNMKLYGLAHRRNKKIAKRKNVDIKEARKRAKVLQDEFADNYMKIQYTPEELERNFDFIIADYKWKMKMQDLTPAQQVEQIALYLLIWGESNQMRFLPECICFIYKCAYDYYVSLECQSSNEKVPEGEFLDSIATPIYRFLRGQIYKISSDGSMTRRERDHKDIIGYDDVNQLFWYPEGIERIKMKSTGERLVDIPLSLRYLSLKDADWGNAFYKTYRETRTWLHLATNFNRIWIIHLSSFWFFTCFNSPTLYTHNYMQLLDNPPTKQSQLSLIALGGTLVCFIQLLATIAEWHFVPREWPGARLLFPRFLCLVLITVINVSPSVFIFGYFDLETHSNFAYMLSIVQLVIAIITAIYFAWRPLGSLFTSKTFSGQNRSHVASQTFTAAFSKLQGRSYWFSIFLWSSIFLAKYIESYFFLTLSLKDPIRVLSIMEMTRCVGDVYIGTFLCRHQAHITLGLVYLTDLILFFLDTYLWYIVCNCIFSMMLSFALGISILTPWRNVYSRLPKRIYSKVIASADMEVKYKPKILISQVWNAVIISMYREHLLPVEMVHKLLYHQVPSEVAGRKTLKSPSFFIAHDDSTYKSSEFFPPNSEAQRRISFFAQSLSTPIPEPIAVECMPVFTVLIPHYGEKIILSLKEIIKEANMNTKITLLEYLKKLYPTEWECFVADTKLMAKDNGLLPDARTKFDTTRKKSVSSGGSLNHHLEALDRTQSISEDAVVTIRLKKGKSSPPNTPRVIPETPILENEEIPMSSDDNMRRTKIDDLPLYCLGFKDESPEYVLRTRIWASLRTQTLYRTASGFVNYVRALKLLYRIENPDMVQFYKNDQQALEDDLEIMAHRKFKMVIAMQRLASFKAHEREETDFLLKAFPEIKVAYLLKEKNPNDPDGEQVFYSCLIDGYCKLDDDGNRIPIYKVRLSGNPILGDGKSDNQNHALIFYRGEYIQVVDANQDNYLEECIKIRSLLAEFEELNLDTPLPYIPGIITKRAPDPVAIVGTREYIFSENIGVLGDVAAGKEQTFGTLFARTLAEIGGKLHYGHPDFLNAIFMTTRGGISKAQKGLHLNEDIYAGMNALLRGGRIKHCDYYQCGKGRDLGFGSILNFTTKIGAGMGEQILSREYYYLGTQLPLDRFLSFYYAHPGFHINNLFIVLSVQMFMIVLVNIGALKHESIICKYDKDVPYTDLQEPLGCYMLQPVLNWVTIFIFSVFLVFFIAFTPLLIQEMTERGLWRAFARFFHHIISLSPLFEVFVCQIYANSLLTDVTFGGARYISTGRGFAMSRVHFFYLYSKFTSSSIYAGAKIFLMLLFATLTIWQPALLWFYITLVSMILAPFIFNPHQFSFQDFFVDYRDFIHWLSRGNNNHRSNSWISFVKHSRARYTGYKKRMIGDPSEIGVQEVRKSRIWDTYFTELIVPLLNGIFLFFAYSFINSQNGVRNVKLTKAILRLVILTFLPIVINAVILAVVFGVSILAGTLCFFTSLASVFASFTHALSVLIYVGLFELVWFLEGWNFVRSLSCLLCIISFQEVVFAFLSTLVLSREYKHDKFNRMWWSGRWISKKVGWRLILAPSREYIVKIMEMSQFALDFILGHSILFVQTPFVFIPFIDKFHTMILLWLQPDKQHKRFFTKSKKRRRLVIVVKYFILYFLVIGMFMMLLLVPLLTAKYIPELYLSLEDGPLNGLIQPNNQWNDDTGVNVTSTIITTTGTMPVFKTHPW